MFAFTTVTVTGPGVNGFVVKLKVICGEIPLMELGDAVTPFSVTLKSVTNAPPAITLPAGSVIVRGLVELIAALGVNVVSVVGAALRAPAVVDRPHVGLRVAANADGATTVATRVAIIAAETPTLTAFFIKFERIPGFK